MSITAEPTTTTPARPLLRDHRIPADGIHEGPRLLRRLAEGAEDRPYERFTLVPQGPLIGAEIRGLDLSRPLTAAVRAELDRALLEWKVLFFRGQHLTSAAQRDFARNWGELETNPLLATGDAEDVVRFDRSQVPTFENVWHTDTTFRENPALGAVLQLREVPRTAATPSGPTWRPPTTTCPRRCGSASRGCAPSTTTSPASPASPPPGTSPPSSPPSRPSSTPWSAATR